MLGLKRRSSDYAELSLAPKRRSFDFPSEEKHSDVQGTPEALETPSHLQMRPPQSCLPPWPRR